MAQAKDFRTRSFRFQNDMPAMVNVGYDAERLLSSMNIRIFLYLVTFKLLPLTLKYSLLIIPTLFYSISYSQNAADTMSLKDSLSRDQPINQSQNQRRADIMNLVPDPGKAVVYIVRPGILGYAVPMRLDCDSFQIGWISAKTFLYTILDPGDHTFYSLGQNEFQFKVHLDPDKVYYIKQDVRMGMLYARSKLELIDEELGKKELAKCTISGTNRYPKFPLSRDLEKKPPKN